MLSVAHRHGVEVFNDVRVACEFIVTRVKQAASDTILEEEVSNFIQSSEFCVRCHTQFEQWSVPINEAHKSPGELHSSTDSMVMTRSSLLIALHSMQGDLRLLLPPGMKDIIPTQEDVDVMFHV